MNIFIVLVIEFIWLVWLFYAFRENIKTIILLIISVFLQILGGYLIFQEGIKADELGISGNVFSNPLSLFLIGIGLTILIVLTVLTLLKSKK